MMKVVVKKNEEKNDELCHNDDGLRLIFIEIYIKVFYIYVVFPPEYNCTHVNH